MKPSLIPLLITRLKTLPPPGSSYISHGQNCTTVLKPSIGWNEERKSHKKLHHSFDQIFCDLWIWKWRVHWLLVAKFLRGDPPKGRSWLWGVYKSNPTIFSFLPSFMFIHLIEAFFSFMPGVWDPRGLASAGHRHLLTDKLIQVDKCCLRIIFMLLLWNFNWHS